MKRPYQPRGGKYQRTNINITPERKRKAVRIGGSISGGIATALDAFIEGRGVTTLIYDKPVKEHAIWQESEKE